MIRFLDKYLYAISQSPDAPIISSEIASVNMFEYVKALDAKPLESEISIQNDVIKSLITEYSSIEVMRALRNTIFTTANQLMRDFVSDPKDL
jgi:hypothetical protein